MDVERDEMIRACDFDELRMESKQGIEGTRRGGEERRGGGVKKGENGRGNVSRQCQV